MIALNRDVATLDEFLEDPLVIDEFALIIRRLGEDTPALPEVAPGSLRSLQSVRIKARAWSGKRERLNDDDAARLILLAWRAYRP